ncbi:MAG: PQQ-binding-like beta-propeller repeat protein [Bauldia sp.]
MTPCIDRKSAPIVSRLAAVLGAGLLALPLAAPDAAAQLFGAPPRVAPPRPAAPRAAAPPPAALGLVDDARLRAAGDATDANWIMFGQDYRNQRYSSLAQISRATVGRLAPAFVFQTGIVGSHQSHPIVVDGTMYVTTPACDVIALNAATGEEIWRYRHRFTTPRAASNRGAAVAYGKVFEATDDHRVVALDQASGRVLWDKNVQGFKPPPSVSIAGRPLPTNVDFTFRAPPLVYDGLVIVSAAAFSGTALTGDYIRDKQLAGEDVGAAFIQDNLGRRGFIAALNANTGEEVWRFWTTKEDGWEGEWAEKAPDGTPLNRDIAAEKSVARYYSNAWAAGSSVAHFTPSLDVATGTLFVGTGNPADQSLPLARPGDNLYSNSLIAVDARTGKLKWYFQAVPHGGNHDLISQTTLFDVTIDGRKVPAVGAGSKTAFYYVVDRNSGKFLFQSQGFADQRNMFTPPTYNGIMVAPGDPGGVSVSPTSYDPTSGFLYVAAINRPNTVEALPLMPRGGRPALTFLRSTAIPLEQASGTLTALDLNRRGRIVWQVKTKQPLVGGALATAGGLVFIGEANGHLNAYDSRTGRLLWTFQTGANVGAPVMTYSVAGRQYVAVSTGAAAPADGTPIARDALRPGGAVFVFALR